MNDVMLRFLVLLRKFLDLTLGGVQQFQQLSVVLRRLLRGFVRFRALQCQCKRSVSQAGAYLRQVLVDLLCLDARLLVLSHLGK
jgi:hypothetical protein